jgi:IS5 family transposase
MPKATSPFLTVPPCGCRPIRTRARVEHVLGSILKQLHGLSVRCIGLRRATFLVGLTYLCYNLLRTLILLSKQPSVGSV